MTTALVAPASTASAAYPACNSWTTIFSSNSAGYRFEVPSIGRNSHSYECQLALNDGYNGGGVQSAVFVLQGSLNGCYEAGLVHDGKHGPNTRNAVAWVRAAAGLQQPPEGFGVYTPSSRAWAVKWLGQRTVGGVHGTICRFFDQI